MVPVKLLIADTQNIVRYGLRYILDSQFEMKIVGEADSWEEVLEKAELVQPDILVTDPFTLSGAGMSSFHELKKLHPKIRLMIVSDHYAKNEVESLLELDISGFVTKGCSREEIINGIQAVVKNEKFFCNKVLNILLDSRSNPVEDCSSTDLTPREIEVVQLIANGMNSTRIADTLSLSTHTVYTHRKNIMRKLKVNNASELVMQAVNAGIIGQQANA